METSLPKVVPKFWKIFIEQDCQLLTAQELADQLEMKPNSVLQTINRTSDYFVRFQKKPVLIGVKPVREFLLTRDSLTCIFCREQKEDTDLTIDTLDMPGDQHDPQLHTTSTICKPCLKTRHLTKNQTLKAEAYTRQEVPEGIQKQVLTRIDYIRSLTDYGEKIQADQTIIDTTNELSYQISKLQQEMRDIKTLLQARSSPKKFEYLDITFQYSKFYLPKPKKKPVDSDKPRIRSISGPYIEYWSWDYNPDHEYTDNDISDRASRNWYLGKNGIITNIGDPSPSSTFELGLNIFGQHGYDIVKMTEPTEEIQWDSDEYDVPVLFKREISN